MILKSKQFWKHSTAICFGLALLPNIVLSYEKDKTYHLTILHTNDHHGNAWANDKGEMGLAARMTLIQSIRDEVKKNGGEVVLLDAGDINTGVPESDLLMAEPDIKGMNLIGYDAMTIGNHEFDNSLTILRQQEEWASFPFLSANIYEKGTDKRLFKPYTILEKLGLNIAVVGLTTEDTVKVGNVEYVGNLDFRLPKDEAVKALNELKATAEPDITIGLNHLGYYEDGKYGSNAPGDVTLARTLPTGVFDFMIGGHSHDAVCMSGVNKLNTDYKPTEPCQPDFQNGTWIMQALDLGKYVGRADIEFLNGEVKLVNYQLIPVNLTVTKKGPNDEKIVEVVGTPIAESQAMLDLLKPFYDQGQAKLAIKVGSVDERLEGERDKVRFGQTNLGQLLLTALIERADADLGIISGGGIRASIEAGEITYKDILKVQPFSNTLVFVDLTGQELKDYLQVAASKKTDSGAYAHFANVSFTLNADGTLSDIKIKNEPLEDGKNYRLATLNFLTSGGDGYPKMDTHPKFVNTGFVDAEVIKAYIEKHSPIKAADYTPQFQHTVLEN